MSRAPSSRHIAGRKSKLRVQERKRVFVPQAPRMRNSPIVAIVLRASGVALMIGGLAGTDFLAAKAGVQAQGAPGNKAIVLIVLGVVMGGLGILRLVRRPG
jgi:hypothetical protein